jgi:ubiquitin carboxyl-terminal hydrolase 9/13
MVESRFSYANSVIQALYFCSPFRDLMLQEADKSNPQEYVAHPSPAISKSTNLQPPVTPTRRKPERKLSVSGTSTENTESTPHSTYVIPSTPPTLFSALRSLFAYIAYHPLQKGTIAPRAFIEKLKELNELFRSSMHQDAHEFLMFLLNRVVEEIEEERKRAQRAIEDCELNVCLHYTGLCWISVKFYHYLVPSSNDRDSADN